MTGWAKKDCSEGHEMMQENLRRLEASGLVERGAAKVSCKICKL